MSEMKTVPGILEVIKSITSNRESGRLEINSSGTYGTLLFHEGKLVDARLGSLSGFQAVNAAVALRDAEFNFDHVEPALHVSTITPNERVILSRFFGIETADMEEPKDTMEPDWNPAPEPVVPLTEVEEIPQTDVQDTPTVEVEAVGAGFMDGGRAFRFFSTPRVVVAVCLALLMGVAAGAIALRSKMQALQQSPAVASAVESQPSAVAESQPEHVAVQPEVKHAESQPEVKKVPAESNASPSTAVRETRHESDERDANVQDLTGEWRVVNTVEKTGYKSFNNMEVGFRLTIHQNGKEFTAKGEKFSENGQTLPAGSRTPIRVSGTIDGDKVVATFVEDGRMRRTNGRFVWKLQGGDALAGTFVSNAAKSSGRSAVTKQ